MSRFFLSCIFIAALPALALAAENDAGRPKLVTGGMGHVQQADVLNFGAPALGSDSRSGFALGNGFALGGYTAYSMAMGGYAAYSFSHPDDSTTSLRVGYGWGSRPDEMRFSPNPVKTSPLGLGDHAPALALALTHDVTSRLTVEGFAATQWGDDSRDVSSLYLGAGLGLHF